MHFDILYGRLALVFEDGAGFISHYCLMDRTACDVDMIGAETRKAQKAHRGEITQATKPCLTICDRTRKVLKMITLISDRVPQIGIFAA